MNDLYRRLEAVTSRLEDMYETARTGAPPSAPPAASAAAPAPATATAPSPPPAPPAYAPAEIADPPAVTAFFEDIVNTKVKQFTVLTESFAVPSVIEQVCRNLKYCWRTPLHLTGESCREALHRPRRTHPHGCTLQEAH